MPVVIDWSIILQSGGAVGLAIFAIITLDRSYKDRLDEQSRYTAEVVVQRQQLIDVIVANTKAFADESQALREMTAAICKELPTVRRRKAATE